MGVDALDIGIKLKILKKQGKPSTQRWLLGELRKDGFPDLSESTLSSILSGNYVVGCANEVLTKAAKIIDAADGAALNPEKWSARLKREMERFNRAYPSIPPLTSHQLRHTYGTWLRRHGVDIHSIAKILGHKSIDVTGNTYVHNELATLRRAIRFNAKQPLIIPIREEQTA